MSDEIMLGGYTFIDGKARLDHCYLCGVSKAAVKHSQARKDPLYCVLMGESTEWGPAEAYQEYDHHVFVLRFKKFLYELAAEELMYEDMQDMADTMWGSDELPEHKSGDNESVQSDDNHKLNKKVVQDNSKEVK